MNVAFLLNSLGIGGSERKVIRISNELVVQGISVHLLYLGGDECLREQISTEVKVVNVKSSSNGLYSGNKFIADYLENNHIRNIFTVNMYPLLYVLYSRLVFRDRLNWVSLINTTYFETVKKEVQMLLYRPILSLTDKNVFGARNQMEVWQSKYFLHRSKSLEVVYNGVDTRRFCTSDELSRQSARLTHELNLDGYEYVFASVAQLRIEKGHKQIIDAAASAKKSGQKCAFLFVGKGNRGYEHELCQYAESMNVSDEIKFIGQVSDPRPYLLCSDAFILASDSETFSNAALEAMSLGLPAILSDVGGAREMVDDGYNGYLFDKNRTGELFEVLNKFVQSDTNLLSKNAQQRVNEQFTFDEMVRNYIKLTQGIGQQ